VIDEQSEVRLRQAGEALTLTIKSGHGLSREENELEIDRATFDDLWPETAGRRVEKVRRKIDLGNGLTAELDLYAEDLDGVAVVEVEFPSEGEAEAFRAPAWFGRELTGDRAWANQNLALQGRPAKALEFRLRPDEDPAAGICRVVMARAAQAAAAVRQAGAAEDPAIPVHEARKSLKKVRSALRLLRGVISDEDRQASNVACRDAAAHLSGARDAEVKLETLSGIAGPNGGADGAGNWRVELESEAGAHRGELTPEGLAEIEAAIDGVAREFRGRNVPESTEQVAGNSGRAYRRGRKAMKQARKSGAAGDFHTWRKRAKDLRYQLEILEPRLPSEFKTTRERAEELADLLGDLHDLDVLAEDLARRNLGEPDRSRLAELIAGARDRQIERCLELGARTYADKPKRFTNRIGEALSDAS
jgi:CYTH domain-containing protein/CHAD domain-containing protein